MFRVLTDCRSSIPAEQGLKVKIYFDCYPCFLNQALQAGRFVSSDETKLRKILDTVAVKIPEIPGDITPPAIGQIIHRIVREVSGENDPYRQVKNENLKVAKSYYELMKSHVKAVDDPLAYAIGLSVIGNIIDSAIVQDFDIEDEIFSLADRSMGIDDTTRLVSALSTASSVLFLGDNAGETVFDRVFIEEIDTPVVYAVRECPILNDATLEDAVTSGLGSVARIISSGTTAPGTLLEECSEEFLELFRTADVVISKGQGNYEALSGVDRPIFFLLRAKCPVVAGELDVEVGSLVLKGLNLPPVPVDDEKKGEDADRQSSPQGQLIGS